MEAAEQEIDSLKVICSWYPLERHTVRNCEPLGHLHSPACSACGAVRGPDQIGDFPAIHWILCLLAGPLSQDHQIHRAHHKVWL